MRSVRLGWLVLGMLVIASVASADTVLNGTSTVNGGVDLNSTPVVNNSGGDGSSGNPWLYAFSDNFSMGAFQVRTTGSPTQSFKLDLGGNALNGNAGMTSLLTWGGSSSGSITIVNAGSITAGGIDSHAAISYGLATPGFIAIGEPSGTNTGPVGAVSVDFLNAACGPYLPTPGNAGWGSGKPVTVYSTGNVTVAGNVSTFSKHPTTSGYIDGWSGGKIEIRHHGTFSAVDLDSAAYKGDSGTTGGSVTVQGNYGDGVASGTFLAHTIDTHFGASGYGGGGNGSSAGAVSVSGYTGAHVTGDILTYTNATSSGYGWLGANITFSGISGDILLDGNINANGLGGDGELKLAATGKITLATLDCNKVKIPASGYMFDAAGDTTVNGQLLNVDVDNATVNKIKAPTGQIVWYYPYNYPTNPVAANEYLFTSDTFDGVQDGIWTLTGGGLLEPFTVVPEPASLGLLLLGLPLLVRRRK